eukprot:7385419-Prymnesium_polylepis.2
MPPPPVRTPSAAGPVGGIGGEAFGDSCDGTDASRCGAPASSRLARKLSTELSRESRSEPVGEMPRDVSLERA